MKLVSRRNVAVLLLLFIVGAVLLGTWRSKRAPLPQVTEKAWQVKVLKAEAGNYKPQVILHGATESPRRATLKAALEADVKATPKKEGEQVKKDELLIQLDDSDIRLLVQQRQAEVADLVAQIEARNNRYAADQEALKHEQALLALNRKSVERQQQLLTQKVGSQAAHDITERDRRRTELAVTERELAVRDHSARLNQLKARLQRAKALLAQAELDQKRTQLLAPFDARVTRLRVSVGDRVQEGDILMTLYAEQSVEVRAQIPASYIAQVLAGLQTEKTLQATAELDGQLIHLVLDRLSGRVDVGRGGVDALFRVEKAGGHLILGRFLQLTLDLPEQQNVYAIPTQALYGRGKIFILKQNRLVAIEVKRVGLLFDETKGNQILVRSLELKGGVKIVITHLPNARTGLLVKEIK